MSDGASDDKLARELEALGYKYCDAQDRGDASDMASLYTNDALLLWPGGSPVKGKTEIESLFAEWIRWGVKNERLETVEIGLDGSSAYWAGFWYLEMPGEDGAIKQYRGKFLWLCQSEASNWRIRVCVISSNT